MRSYCVFVIGALLSGASSQALGASFREAKSAYDRNQVGEAETLYSAVVADPGTSAVDRAAAERELARIAWLIDGNASRSLDHLSRAQLIGDKPCDTSEMVTRVLRQSNQASEAIRRGAALLDACPELESRDAIRTHIVGARLDLVAANPSNRAEMLAAAVTEAREFTPDAGLEAARVRLEAALLAGNADAAVAAWKDYFWLDDRDAPQALGKAGATVIFANGLGAPATIAERLKLAELLMRAGFSEQSRRFADAHGLPAKAAADPVMKRLRAYWSSRTALEAALLAANRSMARRGKSPAVLKKARRELDQADAAWQATLLAAAPGKGEPAEVIAAAYGIRGTDRGETSGYPSIHRGHLVEDRSMLISQYGKTARIRFMSVDNMLANGFESWLWDGGPMVGGWQARGVIVNVRPGYVNSPLRSYRLSQNSPARRELIDRERQNARDDLEKLKARSIATLEGLNDRLLLQVVDRIMAAARSRAPDEASVRRAFLAEYSRANFNQSIEVHEGRHAIDETMGLSGKVEQSVLEYQAKLSELALAMYPRMALRNMNLNLEGDGPHDKAGAKVFDEYRKWLEAHTSEILGHDPGLPLLTQLDKLSDNQIREIARRLDPLPDGRQSPSKL